MSRQIIHGGVGSRPSTRPCGRLWPLLALVAMVWAGAAGAEDRPAARPLTAAEQQRLKERDGYAEDAKKLRAQGKLVEAIAACHKMLDIEREVFGNIHEDVAGSLEQLAEMHEARDDFAAARKAL